MTVTAERLDEATLTRTALTAPFDQTRGLIAPGRFQRAATVVGDLLGAVAIVLCMPFVILAIGIPIALCVRLLLWVGGFVL